MSPAGALDTWREWALARIRVCRADEERSSHLSVHASKRRPRDFAEATGDNMIRANAERRALEASLRMLDIECKHPESQRMRLASRSAEVLRCVLCHAVTEPSVLDGRSEVSR